MEFQRSKPNVKYICSSLISLDISKYDGKSSDFDLSDNRLYLFILKYESYKHCRHHPEILVSVMIEINKY